MNPLNSAFSLDIKKFFDGKTFDVPETYLNHFTLEKLFITDEGFIGVVMMNSIGFRCGYIGIPIGLVNTDNGENEISCHGGITYTGSGILNSTFQNKAGIFETKHLNNFINFFGWDYGHLYDIPDNETFLKYCPGQYTMPDFGDGKKIWKIEDVVEEIVQVSKQLSIMYFNDLNQDISKLKPSKLKAGLQFKHGKLRFLSKGKR